MKRLPQTTRRRRSSGKASIWLGLIITVIVLMIETYPTGMVVTTIVAGGAVAIWILWQIARAVEYRPRVDTGETFTPDTRYIPDHVGGVYYDVMDTGAYNAAVSRTLKWITSFH